MQKDDTFQKIFKHGWHRWQVNFRKEHVDVETSIESDESLFNNFATCVSIVKIYNPFKPFDVSVFGSILLLLHHVSLAQP